MLSFWTDSALRIILETYMKHKRYSGSAFRNFLVSVVLPPLLTSCQQVVMTTVQVGGEIHSTLAGKYSEQAVLEVRLIIDGVTHAVRAPAECRSFVHSIGGMRVTRSADNLFEVPLSTGEIIFIRIPYQCALKDAEISLAESGFVRIYRVVREPSLHIVSEWAVPEDNSMSEVAPIKLVHSQVDRNNKTTNAQPTKRLGGAYSSEQPKMVLTSVYAWQIPLDSNVVGSELATNLRKVSSPRILDVAEARPLTTNIHKGRLLPFSFETYPTHMQAILTQVPFSYVPEDNTFVADPSRTGKRIYYQAPPPKLCGKKPNCRLRDYSVRVGTLTTDEDKFLMIYDPFRKVLYWRFDEAISYLDKE